MLQVMLKTNLVLSVASICYLKTTKISNVRMFSVTFSVTNTLRQSCGSVFFSSHTQSKKQNPCFTWKDQNIFKFHTVVFYLLFNNKKNLKQKNGLSL